MSFESPAPSCNGSADAPPPGDWLEIAVAVVHRRGPSGREVLVARRHEGAIRGGLWEFPGGKLDHGEGPLDAAIRELREETGLDLAGARTAATPLAISSHHDAAMPCERSIRLRPFLIECPSNAEPRALASAEVRWASVEALRSFAWPPANAALVEAVERRLGAGAAAP
jgi:mutator protein MutT